VARLIHLNGPPGIGKSTIARRYPAELPGVLNCHIDVLRTLVGGRERDDGESVEWHQQVLAIVQPRGGAADPST
jgi:adenylate kinase family enzyme